MTSSASSKQYLVVALTTTLLGMLFIAGSSYWINAYGLFGDVRQRAFIAYRGERTTKYLFAHNYLPANFDGLLVGASISGNWNTKRITGQRIYNASLSGGNISEERLIAEQFMRQKPMKRMVLVLHPYLTRTHGRKTEAMVPREYWSALGSLNLFFLQASKLLVENRLMQDHHNEYGDTNYTKGVALDRTRATMTQYISARKKSGKPNRNFKVAPAAREELRLLLAQAARQGTRILIVYPPIYRERFEVERDDWEAYWRDASTVFPDGATVLNFNTQQFDDLRGDLASFQDTDHLSRKCADALVDELARVMSDDATVP